MSEGYVLTSIAYGDITNHSDDDAEFEFGFFIIMSKAPGWKDPQMIECPRKPGLFSLKKSLTKTISQELSKGRCITHIQNIGGDFVVFSAQNDNVKHQEWHTVAGPKELKKLVVDNWDRDYLVSVLVNQPNDKDGIGVLFSKVNNNQSQLMTSFDYMPDPEDFESLEEDDNVIYELFHYIPHIDDWESDDLLFAAANTNTGWDSHSIYVEDSLNELFDVIDEELEDMKEENENAEAYILKVSYFQDQWIAVLGIPM
jgi:hypothetical protein